MACRTVICREHFDLIDAYFPVWKDCLSNAQFESEIYTIALSFLKNIHLSGDKPAIPKSCVCLGEGSMLKETVDTVILRNKFLCLLDVVSATVLSTSDSHIEKLKRLFPFFTIDELETLGFSNVDVVKEILREMSLLSGSKTSSFCPKEKEEEVWAQLLAEISKRNPQIELARQSFERLQIQARAAADCDTGSSVYEDPLTEPAMVAPDRTVSTNTSCAPVAEEACAPAQTPGDCLFEFLLKTVFQDQHEDIIRLLVFKILPPIDRFEEVGGLYTLELPSNLITKLDGINESGIQNFNGGHIVVKDTVQFKVVKKPHPGIEFILDDSVSARVWVYVSWMNGALKRFMIAPDQRIHLSTPSISLGPYTQAQIEETFKAVNWTKHEEEQASSWW